MSYTKLEAIKTIIGRFDAVGETNTDNHRFDNLVELRRIIIPLVREIIYESKNEKSYQHSVKESGKAAKQILVLIKEMIDELFEEENERKEK